MYVCAAAMLLDPRARRRRDRVVLVGEQREPEVVLLVERELFCGCCEIRRRRV